MGFFSGYTGHTGVDTDHDKLLARLETDLKESQQLVKLQQQLLQVCLPTTHDSLRDLSLVSAPFVGLCLQDSFVSPIPSELADSYFLEEWERLQMRCAELEHQRRTFERERQSFTDAAIRLSREVKMGFNVKGDLEQRSGGLIRSHSTACMCTRVIVAL